MLQRFFVTDLTPDEMASDDFAMLVEEGFVRWSKDGHQWCVTDAGQLMYERHSCRVVSQPMFEGLVDTTDVHLRIEQFNHRTNVGAVVQFKVTARLLNRPNSEPKVVGVELVRNPHYKNAVIDKEDVHNARHACIRTALDALLGTPDTIAPDDNLLTSEEGQG